MTKQERNSINNSGEYKVKYNSSENQHNMHLKFYPAPRRAVYGLLEEGRIVYVGSSDSTSFRLAYHLKYKNSKLAKRTDTSNMSYVILEDATDTSRIELQILEQHYMDLFSPTHNKARAISEARLRDYYETLASVSTDDSKDTE